MFDSRPTNLAKSSFIECPFVCENCRCKDCSIVLGFECDCGERHADRYPENPEICRECAIIRQRAANLDPDLRRLRNTEIARESGIDEGLHSDLSLFDQSETGETVN